VSWKSSSTENYGPVRNMGEYGRHERLGPNPFDLCHDLSPPRASHAHSSFGKRKDAPAEPFNQKRWSAVNGSSSGLNAVLFRNTALEMHAQMTTSSPTRSRFPVSLAGIEVFTAKR